MNIIDNASLCAANAMDSFSKNLEDKTEFYFYIRFFFCIFQSCFIVTLLLLYPFMHFIVTL